MRIFLLSILLLAATPVLAQPMGREHLILKDLAAAVSPAHQKANLERLVGFGTRHTGSEVKSEKRGVGAARRWIASEFNSISKECGGRLQVETPSQVIRAERLAGPTEVMNVLGILPGTSSLSQVTTTAVSPIRRTSPQTRPAQMTTDPARWR